MGLARAVSYGLLMALACCTGLFAAEPRFQFHSIEKDPAWLRNAQQTTLSDIDNDGDLDFTTGNVHQNPSLFWYEYITPDEWVQHVIGSDDGFYGGAAALDVNADGCIDIITGEYLFLNKKGTDQPFGIGWDKFNIGTCDYWCHDMAVADVNRDGVPDLITNSGVAKGEGLCWYEAGTDPTQPWIQHDIGGSEYRIHAGVNPHGFGDLDGDGDLDIAAAAVWFENTDGKGIIWKPHRHDLIGQTGPWGIGVKTHVIDVDTDGDLDMVQAECDLRDQYAGLGWLENDGRGRFVLHWIVQRVATDDFHSMFVADYDNDGDPDIMTGNGPLAAGKQTFIFENLAGKGRNPGVSQWKKHVILDGFVAHDGVVGDVDRDGDLDIVSKEWKSGSLYYLENKVVE